jgi:hypothetical protein
MGVKDLPPSVVSRYGFDSKPVRRQSRFSVDRFSEHPGLSFFFAPPTKKELVKE